ncbi:unknown [Clostridium sp. CAG:510]|nr:unknown [Clostridium sp. CAG:510]
MIPDQTQPDEVLQKKLYACLPALGELVHLLQ